MHQHRLFVLFLRPGPAARESWGKKVTRSRELSKPLFCSKKWDTKNHNRKQFKNHWWLAISGVIGVSWLVFFGVISKGGLSQITQKCTTRPSLFLKLTLIFLVIWGKTYPSNLHQLPHLPGTGIANHHSLTRRFR
jgi:hypothetical protein